MKAIDIDIDIHKRIEAERRTFEETPNDILRRILGMEAGERPQVEESGAAGWRGDGVFLPDRTAVRMRYNGKSYTGEIRYGGWLVGGQVTYSPSDAARSAAVTKRGRRTNLNGWIYWWVKRPDDTEWLSLRSLRGEGKHAS